LGGWEPFRGPGARVDRRGACPTHRW
jgi:hypothetical protein